MSLSNSFPTFVSTGNMNLTPFSFAFSIKEFANSSLSSSQIEFPTECPCALKNVYSIAPTIINVSTFSSSFSITSILSDTFLPPIIATKGLFGLFNASPRNFSSFSIKNPDTAGKYAATPAVLACALCAVPNASFTYISAKLASSLENSGSFSSSLLSNLTFSNSIASPSFILFTNSFALSPIISPANFTSFPNNLDSSFATGAKENSGFTCPFGLPKCEHKITLALLSNKYFIVSNAPTILLLSVIFRFSSCGTLKSHLTSTFFPFTSISLTVFLFIKISPFNFF